MDSVMKKVYSRQEARDWFLENRSGSVTCISVYDHTEKVADCFPVADKFYKQKALLSEYGSVKSISKEELAELHKKCNELDIPIGKVAPDMMEKLKIDDKSAISHAGDRLIFKPNKRQKSLIRNFEIMKYKNFEEWYADTDIKSDKLDASFVVMMKEFMRQAWEAAVNSYPEDRTKNEINELQGIITGTLQIQCTCDQAQIKKGYRCSCGKQKAVQKAVSDLTFYLKELKKSG